MATRWLLWCFIAVLQRNMAAGTDQDARSRLMRSLAVEPDADFELPLPMCNGTSVEACDPGMPESLCHARYVCDDKSCASCRRVDDKCKKDSLCKH
mmetsp:Transcript_63034/g.117940  ORF Transcript_63034/g.117940 Transcript_63034/m.117940 type:complete len:96 (-) Transcript_63034:29-316(-)